MQLNLPTKYTAMGRLWLNVLLIVLAVIFAFTPMISLDMSDSDLWENVEVALDELASEFPEFKDIEKPEDKVDISVIKIANSAGVVGKLLTSVISNASEGNDAQMEADLRDIITSKEGQETVIMSLAIATQIMDFESISGESSSVEDNVGSIIEMILKMVIVMYLMVFISIWPIILLITGIVNLVRALTNIKTPELAVGKVGGVLGKQFATVIVLGFMLTMLPGFEWGSGLTAIFVCSIISIVASIVATRLRAYRKEDFMYANVVQGAAILQGVGFAVFFTNLVKSNIVFDFFKSLGNYIVEAANQIDNINAVVQVNNDIYFNTNIGSYIEPASLDGSFIIDVLLVVVFFVIALIAVSSVAGAVVNRITFSTAKVNTGKMFSASIIAIIASLLPTALTKLENKKAWSWENSNGPWEMTDAGAIYSMSSETESAVTGMLVGGIIMLVVAIAFVIVKRILCPTVTNDEAKAVLSGNAPAVEEAAAAVADETSTDEAPADEAPVEEASAEEAPVEDTAE